MNANGFEKLHGIDEMDEKQVLTLYSTAEWLTRQKLSGTIELYRPVKVQTGRTPRQTGARRRRRTNVMKRIGILGAGTWGMARARMLTESVNDVLVWSAIEKEIDDLSTTRVHPNLPQMKIPEELRFTKSVEEVCRDKDILLFAVPSVFVRSTAAKARPYVAEGQIIVDVAKGIEPDTLYTMTEVLADELGREGGPKKVHLVALSGPTHAEEVAIDLPTTIVSASPDVEAAQFVQEVFSTRVAVKKFVPATDCVIELGGEDAKILFLTNGTEVRMNGSCAGGTGAFIDQMATLLKMSADEMNKAAEKAERTYTIASRCGVFAKSDVQPLINQGARTEDIAASIYKAVVNQTIAGLAQGRPIQGNILYLGGPLTFSTVLRKSFDEALGVTGTCPENSLLYVALGAALYADKDFILSAVAGALDEYAATATYASEPPLFANKEEYEAFHARHMSHSVPHVPFSAQCGPVHIGIDSGSTTVKLVVVDEKSQILYTNYQPNLGNPLPLIRQKLLKIYKEHPGLKVASVTTTGYGVVFFFFVFFFNFDLLETVV